MQAGRRACRYAGSRRRVGMQAGRCVGRYAGRQAGV